MRPPLSAIEPCRLSVAIGTRGEVASAAARVMVALTDGGRCLTGKLRRSRLSGRLRWLAGRGGFLRLQRLRLLLRPQLFLPRLFLRHGE